jgi:integrase
MLHFLHFIGTFWNIASRDALWEASQGIDPTEKVKQEIKSDLFGAVADEFIERHAKPKNRGWKEQERDIKRDVLPYWRDKPIHTITRHHILQALDRVSERASPRSANRLLALIKKFFNWCLERGLLSSSPAANIKPPGKEESRDRVLSDDEIRYVWAGCDVLGYPFGSVIKLLLVTAQHRDEVRYMRWKDIDEDKALWTVPREHSKNNVANLVPLSPLAQKIIGELPRYVGEELVFPAANRSGQPASGYSKAKRRLDEEIGVRRREDEKPKMSGWWLHDLRRTAASNMAQLGIQPHVIERVLNHISGSQSGVAGIYNRYGYLDEKRDALETWARHIEELVRKRK